MQTKLIEKTLKDGTTVKKPVLYLSESEYRNLSDDYCGFCLACGDVVYGDTEPDARGYTCDACDAPKVFGIDEAMLMGRVRIEFEN